VHAQHGGRRCPSPLTQNQYCAYSECYQWQLSDWGPCHTEVSCSLLSFWPTIYRVRPKSQLLYRGLWTN